jgi:hypothetical protein
MSYEFSWFYHYMARFDKMENGVLVPEYFKRVMQKQMELNREGAKQKYRLTNKRQYNTEVKKYFNYSSVIPRYLDLERIIQEVPNFVNRNLFSDVIRDLKAQNLTELSNIEEYYQYLVLSMHAFVSIEECASLGISHHYGLPKWVLDLIKAENADALFRNRTLDDVAKILKAVCLDLAEHVCSDKLKNSKLTVNIIYTLNVERAISLLSRSMLPYSKGTFGTPLSLLPTTQGETGNIDIKLQPLSNTYFTYGVVGRQGLTTLNLTSTGNCKLIFFERVYGTNSIFIQEQNIVPGENTFSIPDKEFLKVFIFNFSNSNIDLVLKNHVSSNVFKFNGIPQTMTRAYLSLQGPTSVQYAYATANLVHHQDSAGNALLGASADEYRATGVAGKIVLVKRGTHGSVDKCIRAQEAGAIGVILYREVAGQGPITVGWGGFYPKLKIPNCMIGNPEGVALVTRLKAGETINVEMGFDSPLYDDAKGALLT